MSLTRRQLLLALGSSVALPSALLVPTRTIFLPPRSGWFTEPRVVVLASMAVEGTPEGVPVEPWYRITGAQSRAFRSGVSVEEVLRMAKVEYYPVGSYPKEPMLPLFERGG